MTIVVRQTERLMRYVAQEPPLVGIVIGIETYMFATMFSLGIGLLFAACAWSLMIWSWS